MAGQFQSDVIGKPIVGNDINQGHAIVNADMNGNSDTLAPEFAQTISVSGIALSKHDRFDDTTYYTS